MAQVAGGVTVSDLCFDVNFVTISQYAACTTCTPPDPADASNPYEMYCNTGISFRGQDPVNCVDWNQATFYCQSLGKRLPAEYEYEWAARGATAATTYPWGNTVPTSSDNPERLCWVAERDGFSAWPARPAGSCPVGSYDVAGRSPLGIKDLVGNVWHWTSTLFDPTGYVVRGGGWDNFDASRVTAGFRNGPIPASMRHYAVGIRCVATPN
jgi:formylglycine-generating enzyme required for sulfatase activity